MDNVIFREATASDAAKMIEHMRTVGGETDYLTYGKDTFNISEKREASFISRFSSSQKDSMIIAVDSVNGKILGCGIVEHNRIARLSHNAEISLTVIKEAWGQGIGSRLMEMMIEFAKGSGTHALTLFVRSDNSRAISLYERFGFSRIGTSPDMFLINGVYYSADNMYLSLSDS